MHSPALSGVNFLFYTNRAYSLTAFFTLYTFQHFIQRLFLLFKFFTFVTFLGGLTTAHVELELTEVESLSGTLETSLEHK